MPIGLGRSGLRGFDRVPGLEKIDEDTDEFWQRHRKSPPPLVYNVVVHYKHNDWSWNESHARNAWLPYFWGISFARYQNFLDTCREGYKLLSEIREWGAVNELREDLCDNLKGRNDGLDGGIFQRYAIIHSHLLNMKVVPPITGINNQSGAEAIHDYLRERIFIRLRHVSDHDEQIDTYLEIQARAVENICEVIRHVDTPRLLDEYPEELNPRRAVFLAEAVAWRELTREKERGIS